MNTPNENITEFVDMESWDAGNEWIWTHRELPDSDCTVLIHCSDAQSEPVWLGYHDGEQWRTADGDIINVTHWMELPDPPRLPHPKDIAARKALATKPKPTINQVMRQAAASQSRLSDLRRKNEPRKRH